MKKIRKKIILSLFFIFAITNFVNADSDNLLEPQREIQIQNKPTENPNSNYFNLANIVDTFLNSEEKTPSYESDEKASTRKEFVQITSKYNQGNALNAYEEYSALIDKVSNDRALLALSKVFLELGFFSLYDKTTNKIINKNQFEIITNDLNKSYKPKTFLTKDDEIYFAKKYSDIYFNNSSQEVINELLTKKEYSKNDYYNYTLARAYFENKNYQKAITFINKAIALNPQNTNYQMFKLDSLISSKKYSEAKTLIEKLEKDKTIISFLDSIEIKKQTVLAHLSTKESDRKYYIASQNFEEGNFEKTKKDCLNILNFDKENDKIISLYAKSELALGNIERANTYFVNSYKIEKNNLDTLIGLGDIRYIHGDYKNSVKMYKKALSKDKNNYETVIKLQTAQRQYAQNPKELQNLENKLDKMPQSSYRDYYKSAISIAQKNSVLKEDFLKRTLDINPMYELALGELIELYLKNKNYKAAQGLIYNTSLTLEKNYYHYYLLGLYNQAINKKQDAIQFYKTSLDLNPNFEVANKKLLNLIPDRMNEDEEI